MLVKHVLEKKKRPNVTVRPDATVKEAMDLLLNNRIRCLLVVDHDSELQGILSVTDVFKASYNDPGNFMEKQVSDVMTSDVIVGLLDDDVSYIAGVMLKNRIRHIPVMDHKKLAGIVSVSDILKAQAEHISVENRYLRMYIEGTHSG
ncbi:CBS domain-containing protein [candidate division GN15 bacterium]|nr:CBS domain-containing protein [candidate division GN15 bacterium]